MVTLTAKPDEGFEFDKWLYLSSANPLQIEMNKNQTITPVFKKKNELIQNGNFSQGIKGWDGLYIYSPSTTAATSTVVDSVYVANITKPGTANWHICGQQFNLPLIKNASYTISFDAWADNPNTMDVFFSKNYGDFGAYFSTVKNITKVKQKFTYTTKITQPSDNNCRFGFGFGQFSGKVYIDNVSILKSIATQTEALSQSDDEAFDVFPIPTSGEITIVNRASGEFPTTIKLYNIQGQLVTTLCQDKTMNFEQPHRFNLKDYQLNKGIYLLILSTPERKITRKVLYS